MVYGVLLEGPYLQLEVGGAWRSSFVWDLAAERWSRLGSDMPVDGLRLSALEPDKRFSLEVQIAGETLAEGKATDVLDLSHGRRPTLWVRKGKGGKRIARLLDSGDWNTDDGPWSQEAYGKIIIRATADHGPSHTWDGQVSARGRLSTLAERVGT